MAPPTSAVTKPHPVWVVPSNAAQIFASGWRKKYADNLEADRQAGSRSRRVPITASLLVHTPHNNDAYEGSLTTLEPFLAELAKEFPCGCDQEWGDMRARRASTCT